ncbi:Putative aminoacrylate peracid reductase RutC [Geodia barretti]|uniref:Aminoacrylate peracid reductase RutC n=1 Tax=Geodia barretti TaxID=519541 RepID=A0AA35RBT3_GEOBA|nr:Putative aminoacrylate peracid reductase RutC [Geodia barretti]
MAERKPIVPPGVAPNPALSPGIQVGDFLFVSGNVGQDQNGNLVGEGDCEAQSRQVMANIRAIVEAAGATMADVVKITCFLTDVADYPAYSKVRAETFPSSPPASSTVMVVALVRPEFLVEVEAIVNMSG